MSKNGDGSDERCTWGPSEAGVFPFGKKNCGFGSLEATFTSLTYHLFLGRQPKWNVLSRAYGREREKTFHLG